MPSVSVVTAPISMKVVNSLSYPEDPATWTLEDALEAHITEIRRNVSPRTIEAKRFSIGKFIEYAQEYQLPRLSELKQVDVHGYFDWFAEQPRWANKRGSEDSKLVSASHVDTQFRRLRAFFNWCVKSEMGPGLQTSPMAQMKPVLFAKKRIGDISEMTLQAVWNLTDHRNKRIAPTPLQAFRTLRNRAALCFLIDSPTRLNEINSLLVQDIMFDKKQRGIPDVWMEVLGKGDKLRKIYFGKDSSAIILEYLREREKWSGPGNDALWVSAHSVKGGRMANRWLWAMVSKLGWSVRTPEHRGGVKLHPHLFRHRYALEWLRRGDPEYLLKELAGWSDKIPKTYTDQINSEDAKVIAMSKSPVDRLRNRS